MDDFSNEKMNESNYLDEKIHQEVSKMLSSAINISEIRLDKQNGFFGVTLPVNCRVPGTHAQTAALYTTPFFRAQRSYEIIQVRERHEVAGTDAGTVTVQLKKVPSGTAPASGTSILTSAISLKATADTDQTGTISQSITSSVADRVIVSGDSLCLISAGTLTAVQGVSVTVLLKAI